MTSLSIWLVMMMFRTIYTKRIRNFSESGERIMPIYSLVLDDEGKEVLSQTGYTDMQEEIQSHHDSVCLSNILARYQLGDEDAINKVEGFYADVSNMPVKLNDVLNMTRAGKEIFDKLPIEIRETFGNDYMTFINRPDLYESAYEKYAGKQETESVKKEEKEVKTGDEQE